MNQPPNSYGYFPEAKRPASIAELAERARDNIRDEELKHYLRFADKCRRDGMEFVRTGDLENAFVQFAMVTTLLLETIPAHSHYYTLLKPAQRESLAMNGQDISDNLSDLKLTLVDRFDKCLQAHRDGIDDKHRPNASDHQPMPDDAQAQAAAQYRAEELRREQRRLAAEEAARWRRQRSATLEHGYSWPQNGSANTIVVPDEVRRQQQQKELRKTEEVMKRRAKAKWLQEQQDRIAQRPHEAENAGPSSTYGPSQPHSVSWNNELTAMSLDSPRSVNDSSETRVIRLPEVGFSPILSSLTEK